MTDRRPSGFRLWRQPPPSDHYAPETEAYHHRQNVYFQVKVLIVIGVAAVLFILFVFDPTPPAPPTAAQIERTAQEKWERDHDEKDGAMDWRELQAHMAEGPHGVKP